MAICKKFVTIPPMDCRKKLSPINLPTAMPTTLDTTNLIDYYEFTADDFDIRWDFAEVSVGELDDNTNGDPDSDKCVVSTDVGKQSFTFINWIDTVDSARVGRLWIIDDFSCSGDGSGDGSSGDPEGGINPKQLTIPAPVTFSTNKPSFVPAPYFNPNQSAAGGGGGAANLSLNGPMIGRVESYDGDSVKVRIYKVENGKLVPTDITQTASVIKNG